MPAVPYRELRSDRNGSDSATLRSQVVTARDIQRERFGQDTTTCNARMTTRQLRKHCKLDATCEQILKQAFSELGLSARAHDKVLRVARTIADLAAVPDIRAQDLSEAIMYRRLDRKL